MMKYKDATLEEQLQFVKDYQESILFHEFTCCNHNTMDVKILIDQVVLKCSKCQRVQTDISPLNECDMDFIKNAEQSWKDMFNKFNTKEPK